MSVSESPHIDSTGCQSGGGRMSSLAKLRIDMGSRFPRNSRRGSSVLGVLQPGSLAPAARHPYENPIFHACLFSLPRRNLTRLARRRVRCFERARDRSHFPDTGQRPMCKISTGSAPLLRPGWTTARFRAGSAGSMPTIRRTEIFRRPTARMPLLLMAFSTLAALVLRRGHSVPKPPAPATLPTLRSASFSKHLGPAAHHY